MRGIRADPPIVQRPRDNGHVAGTHRDADGRRPLRRALSPPLAVERRKEQRRLLLGQPAELGRRQLEDLAEWSRQAHRQRRAGRRPHDRWRAVDRRAVLQRVPELLLVGERELLVPDVLPETRVGDLVVAVGDLRAENAAVVELLAEADVIAVLALDGGRRRRACVGRNCWPRCGGPARRCRSRTA